ncbi:MAG: polysaccharide biosynthesis C-terminal domain-containing protein [Rubrivivax sp.]|nr:polysaccharide biosynthesis C-terminal domain-containing protein [Rubrivivax sp.]
MTSLARASAVNLASRLLAVALGLALTLYTARLGTAQQGAFALFLAVEAVLLAVGSGFGVAIARRLSHHGQHPGALVGAAVLACLLLGLLSAAGLWIASGQAGPGYAALAWLALAAPLMFLPGNLSGLWLGRGRMGGLAVLMLAPPLLTLAGIAGAHLAGHGGSLVTVLAAWVTARLLVAAGSALATWRGGWIARPDLRSLRPEARFVIVIGLTNLVSLMNYKVDLFLVERFMGLSATGVYSIAVAVAELLWLVSSAVTTAAYARIGQPDRDAAITLTLRAMHASVLMLLAVSPLLWGAAALLVPALLGAAYQPAIAVLALLLPGVALYGAASALSAWFTNHAGQPQVPALLAAGSLLINIAVSVWAIPRWGLAGGALATTLSYAITIVVGLFWFAQVAGVPPGRVLRPDWAGLRLALPGRRRSAGTP